MWLSDTAHAKEGADIVIEANISARAEKTWLWARKYWYCRQEKASKCGSSLNRYRGSTNCSDSVHRQTAQHQRVDEAEDGRIGPDAQRQRQEGNGRESRMAPHAAKRVA